MQIIFINRFFFPDVSATSQLLTDLTIFLAKEGYAVSVVTGRLRYDDPSERLAPRSNVEGVQVHRVWTSRFGRARLISRILDYATFYGSALWTLLRVAAPGDVIVVKTDPPLIGIPATLVAGWRKAVVVHWCQDLYPETAEELGVLSKAGAAARLLRRLRNWSFTRADMCVVLGNRMAERVREEGVSPDAIAVIPNWVDETSISPLDHAHNPLRRAWGLEDRFVVAYSGNLGRAHEFETLLQAAQALKVEKRIVFLFIGGGHGIERLRSTVEARGLKHAFMFRPYQDRTLLDQSLGAADAHWVSLRPELEGLIVPSKVYGVLAAGRPLIAVADPAGELGQLVEEHACGICVPPGEGERLATVIRTLMNDPPLARRLGERGRAAAQATFARRRAFTRWASLFDTVQKRQSRGDGTPS